MPALPHAQCLATLDVLVIAGGLGTRIQSALGDTPKLLAPIGGRPYLAYLLDWLRHFGAKRIVLGLGHRAQAVIDFLERNKSSYDDLTVVTVIEPEPLGTAGAIRFARPNLRTDPVLVMNGDSFADADLCAFVAHHRRVSAKATLLCAEVDDAGRYGRVELDGEGAHSRLHRKGSGLPWPERRERRRLSVLGGAARRDRRRQRHVAGARRVRPGGFGLA